MKKLIAISVVFALAAGVAFAVDIAGTVIGTVNVIEVDTGKDAAGDPNPVGASAGFNRLRFQGAGDVADGKLGCWIRLDGGDASFTGNAWWKPIDQFKLTIGGNGGDGFWGKEGVTAWMFYQETSDTGVVNAGNAWGGGYGNIVYRNAFYGGFGGNGLLLEIKPFDVLGINIAIPFFDSGKAEDIYSHIQAQVDLNFSFGNIALTFQGGKGYKADGDDTYEKVDMAKYKDPYGEYYKDLYAGFYDGYYLDDQGNSPYSPLTVSGGPTGLVPQLYEKKAGEKGYDDPSRFFLYFGLTAIENLGLDVGLGYTLPTVYDYGILTITHHRPIGIGLGVKYAAGSFGVKFRTVMSFGGSYVPSVSFGGVFGDNFESEFNMLIDVLPYYAVNENLRIYLSAGLAMTALSQDQKDLVALASLGTGVAYNTDPQVGWHVNPYVEVGGEWGPKFVAGVKLWSTGIGTSTVGYSDLSSSTPSKAFKPTGGTALFNVAIPIALMVSF